MDETLAVLGLPSISFGGVFGDFRGKAFSPGQLSHAIYICYHQVVVESDCKVGLIRHYHKSLLFKKSFLLTKMGKILNK